MIERLFNRINVIASEHSDSPVSLEFVNRAKEGGLTRDENPHTHFCVYFAAYDPEARKVFIGHHKKSELWLFNGGHIDEGETPEETVAREIGEEWGVEIKLDSVGKPKLITITEIDNPTKLTCTRHYDIWFFVPISIKNFEPDELLLSKEFYKTGWIAIEQAKNLIIDPNTLTALSELEKVFNKEDEIF